MSDGPPTKIGAKDERDRGLRFGPISISITLIVGIGALVFAATATVLAVSWFAGQRTTIDLLQARAELQMRLVEGQIEGYLEPLAEQMDFLAEMVAAGQVDPDRQPAVWRAMLQGAVAATAQVETVEYWDRDLRLTWVEREESTAPIYDEDDAENAEIRALLTAADPVDGGFWDDLTIWSDDDVALLTYRRLVRRDGEVIGVLSAMVSVRELSWFMADVRDQFDLFSFVLHDDEQVLAHPAMAEGVTAVSADHPLPTLDEIGDPVMAAIWSDRGGVAPIAESDEIGAHQVSVAGEDYIFIYRELDRYAGAPLLVGAYFPTAIVDAELRRLLVSGIAGLIVLAVALAAAILMGRAIGRPIRRLADQASLVGSLEIDAVRPLPRNIFKELDDQARAFNAMLGGLRWFEAYVPRQLVRRLIGRGDRAVRSDTAELSILFTDIADFTSLAEQMSAEQTAAFLNAHFSLLTRCIDAAGGVVDKFIGDAVMAFWGAPEPQADHAERACRAALAMAAAIADDNRRRLRAGETPVRVRIGIHTGTVVVGNIGTAERMNFTIVGDAVNVAQRLEQLGKQVSDPEGGTIILISAACARQLGDRFAVVALGAQQVKGRLDEVNVLRLTGEAEQE